MTDLDALELNYPTITLTPQGDIIMKISKIKAIAKYLTGGWESVAEYLLDLFNEYIQKLPASEVAKYAQLAKDISNFVSNVANVLIRNEAKKSAALRTADCFALLATSMLDSKLTKSELDAIVEATKAAIAAWKEAR